MVSLIADIGATNARFALISPAGAEAVRVLSCQSYQSLIDAILAYLDQVGMAQAINRAAISIAAPIQGDLVSMTNHGWSFSIEATRQHFGWQRLDVVNDFTAVALCLPRLQPRDYRQIGGGTARAGSPMAVLGAGSGLGVSGLFQQGDLWHPLSGEGGHATLAATNRREATILDIARDLSPTGHVSGEFFLCGGGLERLYHCLALADGETVLVPDAARISETGLNNHDPRARETLEIFSAFLGNCAGNLALTLGSFGGVYLAGGIVPRWGAWFDQSPFRAAFEAKGRYRDYLANIPTCLITHPFPAFLGLETILNQGVLAG